MKLKIYFVDNFNNENNSIKGECYEKICCIVSDHYDSYK